MGCLMCYGSKIGWYHRVFLPVIVLELSGGGGGSIWGAVDLCALCMVAAGTCCACVCVNVPGGSFWGAGGLECGVKRSAG